MNEEQAVLEFFAKPENLPLGLAVAVQMDEIREQLNSRFWKQLQARLEASSANTVWRTQITEDRNSSEMLVGLQCRLRDEQAACLFPMMEQQFLGGKWRIFFGLMWQTPASPEQLSFPAVATLGRVLSEAGFKANENFLAWQWTNLHPLRSDFLQRFSEQPEKLLDEAVAVFRVFLTDQRELITAANAALKDAPRSMTISLDQLRRPPKR